MAEGPRDEGFGKLIGLELVERGPGTSLCRLVMDARHLNPHGVLHGGVMYTLADQGMGAALYSLLADGESCATIEIKMVYLAAVRDGAVDCETRVIKKTRRLSVLESDVRSGGELVARALGTYAILDRR